MGLFGGGDSNSWGAGQAAGLFIKNGKYSYYSGVTRVEVSNNALVTAAITAGDFTGSSEYSAVGNAAGGYVAGGHVSLNQMLVTGSIHAGESVHTTDGVAAGITSVPINLQSAYWDTDTTGVPGGRTTAVLQTPSTYRSWNGWRTAPGKYPFPEALDDLYLQARAKGIEALDCSQYACPVSDQSTAITGTSSTAIPTSERATTPAKPVTTGEITDPASAETTTERATTPAKPVTTGEMTDPAPAETTTERAATPAKPVTTGEITDPASAETTAIQLAVTPIAGCASVACPTLHAGSVEHLLYDGQRYHGLFRRHEPEQRDYWFMEQNGQRVFIPCCGDYDFSDLASSGVVVDAAVYHHGDFYVAYHPAESQGQANPIHSTLSKFTLFESRFETDTSQTLDLDYQVVNLFYDGDELFVNSGQSIYRLPATPATHPELELDGEFALGHGETIQSADRFGGDLYLLTHALENGYRIRIVPESGAATFLSVITSSGITINKPVIATLKVSGEQLHLLIVDSGSVIWRKYRLDTIGKPASDDLPASEAYAALPGNIRLAAITMIPGGIADQSTLDEQVFIMGQERDQPSFLRLMPTDFVPVVTSRVADEGGGINNWPLWAKASFGAGFAVTGVVALSAASYLAAKTWNLYRSGNKPQDSEQNNQQRNGQTRPREQLPALPMEAFSPSVSFSPEGSSMIAADILPDGQPYEEAHIYETIDPATGVIQAHSTPAGQVQPYEEPVLLQAQAEAEPLNNVAGQAETYEFLPGQVEIHQQPEQEFDELDGFPLEPVSEEPWYANTNLGFSTSAPVFNELNKPSAKRTLQHMLAQQDQQAEAGQLGPDHLGGAGPGPTESATYFQTLIQLEGAPSLTGLSRLRLNALATGFNLIFRGMEAVDSYVYDFPPGHTKRTRIHKQHVAEVLYGEHLTTEKLFDNRIGHMEDPVIAFCNAMGENVWHAFLVFRNSRTGKYNTLHIRQGSYYPEFMDRQATERYFMFEEKKIVGAVSLAKLTELYGATLDLELLRNIFGQRMNSKEMSYRIKNQNCMTFSMLAFWATNLDWATFLQKMGLAKIQSPFHILKALEGGPRNHPALHSEGNNLLPDWLAELNQNEE